MGRNFREKKLSRVKKFAKFLYFAAINFREWVDMKYFTGINFREWVDMKYFAGKNFREWIDTKYFTRVLTFATQENFVYFAGIDIRDLRKFRLFCGN